VQLLEFFEYWRREARVRGGKCPPAIEEIMMMTQTIAVERVDHIGVRVRDLDRALAFCRVLGFE